MTWGKKTPNPNIIDIDFLKALLSYLWPILLIGRGWHGQTHFWEADRHLPFRSHLKPCNPIPDPQQCGEAHLLGIFWHNTLETPDRNRRQREEYDHWSLTSSIVCVWNAVNQVWAMYWIWIFRGPAIVFFRESINPFVSLFSWEANVLHCGTEWLRCNTRVMSWFAS